MTNTIYGVKIYVTLIYMRRYRPYRSVCSGLDRELSLRLYAYHMGKSGGNACVSKTLEILRNFWCLIFLPENKKGERNGQRSMGKKGGGGP